MNIRDLRKYLPTREDIAKSRVLRPIHHWLVDPNLWHMNRDSVPKAAFIGIFCSFIPIPAQMILAALIAIPSRANLPLALAGCWLSNPLTFAPIFYFCYQVGALFVGKPMDVSEGEMTGWTWIFERLELIWQPFLLGSFVCAWVGGLTALTVARFLYRMEVARAFKNRWKKHLESGRFRTPRHGSHRKTKDESS